MSHSPPTTTASFKTPTSGVFAFPCRLDVWQVIAAVVALIVLIPVAVTFAAWLRPQADIMGHLAEFVLPELLLNTLWLLLGVGVGVAVLGVSLAWLNAMCEFPGRAFFAWALLLPLAMPAYVLAFVLIGLLDFTGPVQTALREVLGPLALPSIRSRGGVILVMSLALYPYVYLIARNAFQSQGRAAMEAAQSLGMNRWQGFFKVALPMARPWIAAGVALALMETLADFGTVSTFNYDTFTTGIYKAWYSLFSLHAASQLASILIVFVLVLALTEQRLRAPVKYNAVGRSGAHQRIRLSRVHAALAFTFSAAIFAAAFLVPMLQLLWWAKAAAVTDLDARYWSFFGHSLWISGIGAITVALVALVLACAARQRPSPFMQITQRIATIGYAIPGAVLAVGVFIPVAWIDEQLLAFFNASTTQTTALTGLLKGTLFVVVLAYTIRFLAVGFAPLEAGLQRITKSTDDAARVLGCTSFALLWRVHLPILRPSLFAALALSFVDMMKEMPITLMTRPFGWDTLATRVFEMTSEGQWQQAALPSVAIVFAGLLPVIYLATRGEK
jgi:iron(III) transport system permease protein